MALSFNRDTRPAVGGTSPLSIVRNELFSTMEHTERCFDLFLADRHSGNLLQQFVEVLQQIRGTLKLIELSGAELLAEEMVRLSMDIPADAGKEWDERLSILGTTLYVLRRYLENMEGYPHELPELLLPSINALRQAWGQPTLLDSHFFSARLDIQMSFRVPSNPSDSGQLKRLRHMYQLGLLGVLREENTAPSLRLMTHALERLQRALPAEPSARLCWVGAAALESMLDCRMLLTASRKKLFSSIDRELRLILGKPNYEPPLGVLKDLLYLIALANRRGPRASVVQSVYSLASLPFSDQMLSREYQFLAGPGQDAICALASAIRDDVNGIKLLLGKFGQGESSRQEQVKQLQVRLFKLMNTLDMVGQERAHQMLSDEMASLEEMHWSETVDDDILNHLAETILYVESITLTFEGSASCEAPVSQSIGEQGVGLEAVKNRYLTESRRLVIKEARICLDLARHGIVAYLESGGDRHYLDAMQQTFYCIRGALWFLNQIRASELIGVCGNFVRTEMVETTQVPEKYLLESLADVLTSLEFYLEVGDVASGSYRSDVLDLAEESISALVDKSGSPRQ